MVSLLEALDKDSVFRAAASHALMKIGEPAVDSLVELLNAYAKHHADSDKGYDIIAPLTIYGDVRTTDALISIMKRARIFNDKEEAAKALGMVAKKNHNEKAIKALFYALTEWYGGQNSIIHVITALGLIKSSQSVEVLMRLLQKYPKNDYVISALGNIGDARAKEALEKLDTKI